MSLGDFLKLIRKRHSLTQEELGRICLRSGDWIYLVENGKINPSTEDLELLSKGLKEPLLVDIAYGLTIKDIFNRLNVV